MRNWTVDQSSDSPPSRQLVEACLDAIASGELAAGERLPSVRGLASLAMVNANTVSKAYRDLEAMGVVRGENGRGVFVTERGESVAREARGATTLERFERACHEALRAGHDVEQLEHVLRQARARKSA